MERHQHKAITSKSRDIGWTICVTPDLCEAHPARQDAHGGVVQVDTCTCGATRETEINGETKNRGPWIEIGE